KLTTPKMTKELLQEVASISQVTRGGVTALPIRAAACVIPCANPRFVTGTQLDMALVAVGKVAPSPSPSKILAKTREISPSAKPERMVAPAQMKEQIVSVRLGPKRSPTHPPMI